MSNLPTGIITFLFTDIEGSTKRWEAYPADMQAALSRHDALLRSAIKENGGYVFKTVGDAFCAAFANASRAVKAAFQAQQALQAEAWDPQIGSITARVALHTGEADERDGDYFGQAVNRVARLLSAGHGGQTLVSAATYELVQGHLPAGVTLRDMGEHRLKDLIRPEHIFQLVAAGLPSEFPPLRTLDNRPNNLPLQPTLLVGRENELARVGKLLEREDVRLVTLTGPGGTGKTRLALQVASDLLDDFPDGAWFVELASLVEHTLVVRTMAAVLGVKEEGSTPIVDTLKEFLKDKRLLLVLDNFEQVANAAPQVIWLLASCPQLKVLVTSRVPLNVRGEKEYLVPPLSVPDVHHLPPLVRLAQYESVRLFIDRATDVKPNFQVTNDNAPAVAEICARLDGLPLAIELAAARVRMLSPEALLSRLSQRLKVLTGGARDLPARQQTLRNTIEWSYDLLDEGEKQLFRRMAPFNGGRSLEALEAVCNSEALQIEGPLAIDVFDGVGSLLSKNLLREVEGSGGEPRFWMLGTIHEYAREKLEESGEADALEREHALFFTALAEAAEPELTGKNQVEWYNKLDEEHDNVRAALAWAIRNDLDLALRLSGAFWRYWFSYGYLIEGRKWLEEVIAAVPRQKDGQSSPDRQGFMKALFGAGVLATHQSDYARSDALISESLDLARALGNDLQTALSLSTLGINAYYRGDYKRSVLQLEEALPTLRRLGYTHGTALALNSLSNSILCLGDSTHAATLAEESLELSRRNGDTLSVGASLTNLGRAALQQGQMEKAIALFEESMAIRVKLKDNGGLAHTLCFLGNVALIRGDIDEAASHYARSLALRHEMGDREGMAAPIEGLAAVAGRLGNLKRAARLYGAAEALREAIGAPLPPTELALHSPIIASLRSGPGGETMAAEWAAGRAMNIEEAVGYALGES